MDLIVDKEEYIQGNIKEAPGRMYDLGKSHQENNCVKGITSGWGTTLENLSIFVKRHLFPKFLKWKEEFKIHLKCLTLLII